MSPSRTLLFSLLVGTALHAQGLDRDTLLTDAPAVPAKGTVRVTGGATGTTQTDDGTDTGHNISRVSGNIQWTPVEHLAGDVGVALQIGASGPSARLRYQILSQERVGIDLAAGARFKTVGFHPDRGEVEFLVAAGRRFGAIELVLNGVFGFETGGASGKDVEVKGFAGYRFNDAVRAGLDGRIQTEVSDEENVVKPPGIRDYDLVAGPAVSWLVTRAIQVQALVGVAQPKKTDITSPVGLVAASFDF